jgi:hypothetical protein
VSGANLIEYSTALRGCKYYKRVYKFINEFPDPGTQLNRITRFKKIQKSLSKQLPHYERDEPYSYDYTNNLIYLYGKRAATPKLDNYHCDKLLCSFIFHQYLTDNYWANFCVDNILSYIEENMRGIYSGTEFIDMLFLVPARYDIQLLRKYVFLLVKIANRECRYRINTLLNSPPFGANYVSNMRKFTESVYIDDDYNYKLMYNVPRKKCWCS